MTVHDADGGSRAATGRIRRRDRHGRGLRGSLVPPGVPLYRSRSDRFDDLVLLAVSQLEPRWDAELADVEFAVEEIPPVIPDSEDPEPIPLARLELHSAHSDIPRQGSDIPRQGSIEAGWVQPGAADPPDSDKPDLSGPASLEARIVLYRRPLMARADGEEELAELVLDVIVEQFARWLGVDPQAVDPGYPAEE